MVSDGKLNSLITATNLPFKFAYQPTRVKSGALIGISAAGWGGVNSHVVVQVPPAKILKTREKKQSKYGLRNEKLAAPRKLGLRETSKSCHDESVSSTSIVTPSISTSETIDIDTADGLSPVDAQQVAKLVEASHERSSCSVTDSPLGFVIREVNRVLKIEPVVAAEDDLRAAGLDSLGFVKLARNIKRLGEGFHLP